jgi:hypothetical protein
MADAYFLATYLQIGVDYEFDIKTTKFTKLRRLLQLHQFPKRAIFTESHSTLLKLYLKLISAFILFSKFFLIRWS